MVSSFTTGFRGLRAAGPELSVADRNVLDVDAIDYQLARTILGIESRFWRFEAVKLDVVKRETGLGPTRYYQLLNALAADPSPEIAAEFAPVIGRLRRRVEVKLRLIAPRSVA